MSISGTLDPTVHGPQPELGPWGGGDASDADSGVEPDLNASSPLRDAELLVCDPERFFSFFRPSLRLKISGWLAFKAIVGFFVCAWLGEVIGHRHWFEHSLLPLLDRVDDQTMGLVETRMGVSGLRDKLTAVALLLSQLRMIVLPVLSLALVLLAAASTSLMLVFLGVKQERISLPALFVMGCYAGWFQIFLAVPGVGRELAGASMALMWIFAVKWAFDLGFWRAFIATHLLNWLVVFFIGGVAFAAAGAFAVALGH